MQSPRCRLVAGPSKGHHPQQQHYSAQRRAKTALPALASTFFPPTTSLLSEEDMCMCIHNKAVGCPGACRSHPPINYYGCGLVLAPPRLHPAFAPRETMTFVPFFLRLVFSFPSRERRHRCLQVRDGFHRVDSSAESGARRAAISPPPGAGGGSTAVASWAEEAAGEVFITRLAEPSDCYE